MTSPTPTDAAAPSPTPSPSPLFLPPPPSSSRTPLSEQPSEQPPTPPTPGLSSDPDDADAYELSGPASPSSTPSTGSDVPARPKIAALRAICRQGVRTAGGFANALIPRLVTRNPAETVHQVWVPTDEDEKAIAEPIARIASRRAPSGVTDNPDIFDLGQLALALVDYVRKSLEARAGLLPESYMAGPDDGDDSQQVETGTADLEAAHVAPEQQAATPATVFGGSLKYAHQGGAL